MDSRNRTRMRLPAMDSKYLIRPCRAAGELRFGLPDFGALVSSFLTLQAGVQTLRPAKPCVLLYTPAMASMCSTLPRPALPIPWPCFLFLLLDVRVTTTSKQNDSSSRCAPPRSCKLRNLLRKRSSLLPAPSWLNR